MHSSIYRQHEWAADDNKYDQNSSSLLFAGVNSFLYNNHNNNKIWSNVAISPSAFIKVIYYIIESTSETFRIGQIDFSDWSTLY